MAEQNKKLEQQENKEPKNEESVSESNKIKEELKKAQELRKQAEEMKLESELRLLAQKKGIIGETTDDVLAMAKGKGISEKEFEAFLDDFKNKYVSKPKETTEEEPVSAFSERVFNVEPPTKTPEKEAEKSIGQILAEKALQNHKKFEF